jgi:hypothetical protein
VEQRWVRVVVELRINQVRELSGPAMNLDDVRAFHLVRWMAVLWRWIAGVSVVIYAEVSCPRPLRHSTAEEPITVRIRKRQDASVASNETVYHDGAPTSSPAVQPEAGENTPSSQPMRFQERIAMERRRPDHETSLP